MPEYIVTVPPCIVKVKMSVPLQSIDNIIISLHGNWIDSTCNTNAHRVVNTQFFTSMYMQLHKTIWIYHILLNIYYISWRFHDDVIKWKHFPRYCPYCPPVTGEFPTQRPVTRNLMFSLICSWISGWVNNHEAGDLRRRRTHYDVTVMCSMNVPYWAPNLAGVDDMPSRRTKWYIDFGRVAYM